MIYELTFEDIGSGGDVIYEKQLVEAPAGQTLSDAPAAVLADARATAEAILATPALFQRSPLDAMEKGIRVTIATHQLRRIGYRKADVNTPAQSIDIIEFNVIPSAV